MRSVLATEPYKNRALFEKGTFRKGDKDGAKYPKLMRSVLATEPYKNRAHFEKDTFRKGDKDGAKYPKLMRSVLAAEPYKNGLFSKRHVSKRRQRWRNIPPNQ